MNNKTEEFILWVCGKTNKFPFFKDLPQVEMPISEIREKKIADAEIELENELNLDGSIRTEKDELRSRWG